MPAAQQHNFMGYYDHDPEDQKRSKVDEFLSNVFSWFMTLCISIGGWLVDCGMDKWDMVASAAVISVLIAIRWAIT